MHPFLVPLDPSGASIPHPAVLVELEPAGDFDVARAECEEEAELGCEPEGVIDMQWKLYEGELWVFAFNVLGGLAFYLFVLQPHLGSQSWFTACVPAGVGVLHFLTRPLFERMRSGSGAAARGPQKLNLR